MEKWFSADHHFFHEKIVTLQPRPFPTVDDMNEALICRWNSVVKPGDIVYHLGDFAKVNASQKEQLGHVFSRLNGEKQLIRGNHDEKNPIIYKLGWRWVGDIKVINIDGQVIVLCHRPMQVWDESMNGSWHLYGHVHGKLPEHSTCFKTDVGVDACNLRPISFGEVKEIMLKRTFAAPDKRRVYYEEDLPTAVSSTSGTTNSGSTRRLGKSVTIEYRCITGKCKYYSDCLYACTSKAENCRHFDPKSPEKVVVSPKE